MNILTLLTSKAGHSTETALVVVQNDILTTTEKHGIVSLILLGLSAVSDTISHDLLVSKNLSG